ncbi:hypothetical protein [Virgibacillus proomii]|uniref:hypothetical protein n=1 Tax=Virgibacillus proomii TaxID=84407 RepID=UPI00098724DB|nr:hypothetical protein [Virgibacillus proomii]
MTDKEWLEEIVDVAEAYLLRNGKEIMELTNEKAELQYQNQRYKQAIEKAMKALDWGDPSNAIEKAKLILAVASKGESDATRALEVKQENPGQGWF